MLIFPTWARHMLQPVKLTHSVSGEPAEISKTTSPSVNARYTCEVKPRVLTL